MSVGNCREEGGIEEERGGVREASSSSAEFPVVKIRLSQAPEARKEGRKEENQAI